MHKTSLLNRLLAAFAVGTLGSAALGESPEEAPDDYEVALTLVPVKYPAAPSCPLLCFFQGLGTHAGFSATQIIISGILFQVLDSSAEATGLPTGTELWKGEIEDTEGWIYGFEAGTVIPALNHAVVDFRYQTGELDGDFRTWPLSGGPTFGADLDIDREVWELGVTYPLPFVSFAYGRVEYFHQKDEATLDYGGGYIERQDYEWQGVRAGLGAEAALPLGNSPATLDLDVFGGIVFWDYEVHEKTVDAKTDFDGIGFVVRGGARIAYPLSEQISATGGVQYEWMTTNDGPDLDNFNLGLHLGIIGSL